MIGLFDSGVGGLCVLAELRTCLPRADFLYFADTRHLPYGGREAWELLALGRRAVSLLSGRGARAVLAACGTISSTVLPALRMELSLPLFGILEPLSAAVCREARGQPRCRVALLATQATVEAGVLADMITAGCDATVFSLPCPALVEMAEQACWSADALRTQLQPLQDFDPQIVALGCTHFSRLVPAIAAAMPGVRIVDGAREAALATAAALPPALCEGEGRCVLYTSGSPTELYEKAKRVLGEQATFTCSECATG